MSHEPRKVELSATQVTASALAAVVGAAASARLGTAGTFIGAGVVSVVATTGSAIFSHSMRRTKHRVQTVVLHHADLAQQSQATTQQIPMLQRESAAQDAAVGGPLSTRDTMVDGDVPAQPIRTTGRSAGNGLGARWRSLRWRPVLAVTMLVFAIAVLGVTAVELVGGKSLNDIETGKQGSGTSLAHVVGGGSTSSSDSTPSGSAPAPAPSSTGATPSPSSSPSTDASPSPGASATASASASSQPSSQPSAQPSATPSTSPSTGAAGD